ncbi:MAG: SPOR domain-containing protein [Novosphingobium sp.]|nr:SPOR domain-containing protein [Novosphingobium sp.]
MNMPRKTRLGFHHVIGTALAISMIANGPGVLASPLAKVKSGSEIAGRADLAREKDLARIEARVAKAPANAALRAALASAYLAAGRFVSAATTFEDAIALGDASPRTALGLSLAYIGTGRNQDALRILDQWRDAIPAGDLGLAIALAGEGARGIAILSDALRSGAADAKLRQNLAYAYALEGRWLEARLMALQDLPPDQVDDRMSQWAMQSRPEEYHKRVASLLGAPLRADPGQPPALALARPASEDDRSVATAEAGASNRIDPDRELPPVDQGESPPGLRPDEPRPLLPPARSEAVAAASPGPEAMSSEMFDSAFGNGQSGVTFVSNPVVQPLRKPRMEAAPMRVSGAGATHLVQLGSFSSPAHAERAWTIYKQRYPGLRDEDLRISEAVVRGKRYWRVAVAGFDDQSARAMCSTVRRSGHGCLAYAQARPLPGAIPQPSGSGTMLAHRR